MLKLENVSKSYASFHAVNNVNLTIESGEQIVLRGASGCGKSTLLHLIAGLDTPSRGKIIFENKEITSLDDKGLSQYRNATVGLVFQFHFLLPSMNSLDNILLPARIGNHHLSQVRTYIEELAERLGMTSHLLKMPYELSGGEQQRINIIRALSLRPKLLLCDEPTGNLDSHNSELVIELLRHLAQQSGATMLVVTHDQQLAQKFSRQIMMRDGKILL